jgi:hypothetical protein
LPSGNRRAAARGSGLRTVGGHPEPGGLATEQRQYTAGLLDAYLSTVTDLPAHGSYTPAVGLRLRNAHGAGGHDMGVGRLGDLAYQAAWRHDHTSAAGILNHALTRAQNPAARCSHCASPAPSPRGTNAAPYCAPSPQLRLTSVTPVPTARLVRMGVRRRYAVCQAVPTCTCLKALLLPGRVTEPRTGQQHTGWWRWWLRCVFVEGAGGARRQPR